MIISELSRSLAMVAWYFGPKGLNGECCGDLTMPEFMAMDKVSSTTQCSVQAVGNYLGFTKSGATRVVNRLEKKGCVKKLKTSQDGRICCVEITEKGKNILKEVDRQYTQQFAKLKSKMPQAFAGDIEQVIAAMAGGLKHNFLDL